MNVEFVMVCRNKAHFVAKTVDSILAQTYSPMLITLSDQGSDDGSTEILLEKARAYDGPNEVRVVHCPDQHLKGHAGLALHWNWLHKQMVGDLIIATAADDLNHPDRAKHTVAAFEMAGETSPAYLVARAKYEKGDIAVEPDPKDFRPSYIATRCMMRNPDGSFVNETFFHDRRSRWVLGDKWFFDFQIGSAGSGAWARDLYEKHGPLVDCECQDMILPVMALIERGFYFVDLPLHTHILHADAQNTGYDGRIRLAREGSREWYQLSEINAWLNTLNWWAIVRRLRECGGMAKLAEGGAEALMLRAQETSYMGALLRERLTMRRIEPKNLEV